MDKLSVNEDVVILAEGYPRATVKAITDTWCICKLADGRELPVTLDRVARAHMDSPANVEEKKVDVLDSFRKINNLPVPEEEKSVGMTEEKKKALLNKFNKLKEGTVTTVKDGVAETRSLTEQEIDKTLAEWHKIHDKMWDEFEVMHKNFVSRLSKFFN